MSTPGEAPTEDESFVESWLRKAREREDLSTAVLDLIDEHRSGNELKESALLQALVEHADSQNRKENESAN